MLPLPASWIDALLELVDERVSSSVERRRWAVGIEGLASYLGCDVGYAKGLRAKGLPGNVIGKRIVFDLR